MSEGNSLINLGDMSKPASILIEKISEGVGGIFKPWQIRRVASAEADADKIKAISNIEMTELEQQAMQRLVREETKMQKNMESITSQSLPQLNESARPEDIEEDWITNFFNKCRLVSDKEMQSIWARILASEANEPGKFSKRTINFMESLDKQDAQFFTKLCAFNWILFKDIEPLIYDINAEIYTNHGLSFSILQHLDTIGLISFDNISGYKKQGFPQTTVTAYNGASYTIKFPKEKDNNLELGKILLTSIGRELVGICVPETVVGFDEYVIEKWKKEGLEINQKTIHEL